MNRPSRIEVLAIGDELLDGRVADTNTLRFAQKLATIGLGIDQRCTVGDDIAAIAREAQAAICRGTQLCVVSGGLGPTSDDVTAQAFAEFAGVALERDSRQVTEIEKKLGLRDRAITENQRKQADRPKGAAPIENLVGTAPGFCMVIDGCRFVSVPGVPMEFDPMVEAAVIAPLREGSTPRGVRTLRLFGLPEAEADARLAPCALEFPDVAIGYRAHFPEIHVTLHSGDNARDQLERAFDFARQVLAEELYATDERSYAAVILEILRRRGFRLALAESCTGGLIGDMLTDVEGSSDVLWGGGVVYDNAAKVKLLGVDRDGLHRDGAVSENVARQMVQGILQLARVECALAVSGIAGPGGGSEDKPVGTVWIAVATPAGVRARRLGFPFDRRRNKVISAYSALELLRRELQP